MLVDVCDEPLIQEPTEPNRVSWLDSLHDLILANDNQQENKSVPERH
jgi:hypothetical protein